MITRRLALLALGPLLTTGASAQEKAVLGSLAITWDEIQALPLGSGGRARQLLRQPTATLDELEMHITWLPPGQTTHPPHTHPNEEVIVVREGTLEAFQNGKLTRVGPGSILFMASNEPHNVVNVGDTTAVYHVINWHSPGMLKAKAPRQGAIPSPSKTSTSTCFAPSPLAATRSSAGCGAATPAGSGGSASR